MAVIGHHNYNFRGPPGLTGEALFKAMCKHRSRLKGNSVSSHADLAISPDQERHILTVTARDLSIGAMLDAALDINIGKGLATRKLNLLGEVEGVACIANDPERLRRLRQARNIGEAVASIKLSRLKKKEEKKKDKSGRSAAKEAKRAAERPLLLFLREEELLTSNEKKITLPPLKALIQKYKLSKYVPVGLDDKKMSKINLMTFWTLLCAKVRTNNISRCCSCRTVHMHTLI
jgi:hypothetical protein